MLFHKKIYSISLLCGVLFLSACVTRKYEKPEVDVMNLYRDQSSADTSSMAQLKWSDLFQDAALQQLINQGLSQNLDLKAAIERIRIAEANLQSNKLSVLPNLQLDLNGGHNKVSQAATAQPLNGNNSAELYKAQLSSTWELDIWGKLASAKRAAYAQLLQSDAARRAIKTQLVAQISNAYFQLVALDAQLKITQQTLEVRKQDVETMKALKGAGRVTGAAVVQSEANLYAAQVSIPDLHKQIREVENTLQLLLAKPGEKVMRADILSQSLTQTLQTGIPAQLLQNRPDVQAAELAFRAAFENTNMARTFFYPSLSISAGVGLSSLSLAQFFSNSLFYNVLGGITQPLFNQGKNQARLSTAQAQQQIALYEFQKSLLNAGQEVSNAMYAYQTAKEKQDSRTKQIEALEKAVSYTKELLTYSSATNYTDVLTSEQSLLNAKLNQVNDKLQELQSVVNLYRALGGGWQ